MKLPLLIIALFCVLADTPLFAQNTEIAAADEFLTKYYHYKQVPSVSAGLMKDGKIAWQGSRGFADLENKVPAKPETVYRIASISKIITSAAIIRLASLGRINLDEDILYYLQGIPKKRWRFTVRQVLNHTSGLRTYYGGEFDSKAAFANIDEVMQYLAKDTLMHEPGTKYLYSSLSYTYLAALIEKATGMSFTEYMQKYIFDPAGMTQTRYDMQSQIIPHRAHGYDRGVTRETANAPLADLSIKFPGGGVLSTVEDLLKFGNGLVSGAFFPKNYLDTMMQITRLKNGSTENYGLGLAVWKSEDGKTLIGHAGGGTGFVSQITIQPESKLVAVHLINTRDSNLENPANELMKLLLNEKMQPVKKSIADAMFFETLRHGADSAMVLLDKYKKDSSAVYAIAPAELKPVGKYLSAKGKHFDAAKWFAYAYEVNTSDNQLLLQCADAYAVDNNKGMAIRYYKRFLQAEPGNQTVMEKLKKLEQR